MKRNNAPKLQLNAKTLFKFKKPMPGKNAFNTGVPTQTVEPTTATITTSSTMVFF